MEVVLLVGLPGAGKSTFCRVRFASTHVWVSKDLMRRGSNKAQRQRREIEAALSEGRSVVVDNTNVSRAERAETIELAKAFGARVVVYRFAESVAACRDRNALREGDARVPLVAIYTAAKRYEEPSLDEGIDELHVVRLEEHQFLVDTEAAVPGPQRSDSMLNSMSNTATAFDLKSFLTGIIQRNANRLADDLSHLTPEQLSASPMGVARNPLHFSAECIGFNSLVVNAFAGAPSVRPSEEAREKFFASFDSLEKAQAGLRRSADEVAAAIAAADEAKLMSEAMAPWGEPMPLYMLVYVAADHMSYHDGQVNYIQTLYGDAEVHWG